MVEKAGEFVNEFQILKSKIMNRRIIFIIITLLSGIFIGWLFFHPSHDEPKKPNDQVVSVKSTVWTCSMHPQIRMQEPGKCPICGMDLIPLGQNNTSSIDPDAVRLTKDAAQLANVLTSTAKKVKSVKEVRLYGKIQADERMLQSQVAHVQGRIERLAVNFTGEAVVKGQVLAEIYSPELITAQQELLEAAGTKMTQPDIYEAAKEKLRQWKLTDNQIESIEKSATAKNTIEVISNTNGVVTARRVNTGDYISQGTVLFEIADLSKVWVMFDAYESDLQFLNKGEKVSFTIQALPGNIYSGNIVFIDPVLDPVTRVAKVRVEAGNLSGKLKPEMFASGIAISNTAEYDNNIVIPKSAVLWTGKRSIVYVKLPVTDGPVFKMRQIELGPVVGESYVVMKGLNEGEEVVTSGAFSVDASAQLEGKQSMMNIPQAAGKNTEQVTFIVSGLCEMCKDRIEKAALSVSGVSNAYWDVNKKEASIDFDTTKTDKLSVQRAIAKAGHDTEPFKADDATYNALPDCCLYRK
jgi:Cu(I)/Ag(I) efflux system membrane fusion protein